MPGVDKELAEKAVENLRNIGLTSRRSGNWEVYDTDPMKDDDAAKYSIALEFRNNSEGKAAVQAFLQEYKYLDPKINPSVHKVMSGNGDFFRLEITKPELIQALSKAPFNSSVKDVMSKEKNMDTGLLFSSTSHPRAETVKGKDAELKEINPDHKPPKYK